MMSSVLVPKARINALFYVANLYMFLESIKEDDSRS
jgi:hypothetical protein